MQEPCSHNFHCFACESRISSLNYSWNSSEFLSMVGCIHGCTSRPCPRCINHFKYVLGSKERTNSPVTEKRNIQVLSGPHLCPIPLSVLVQLESLFGGTLRAMHDGEETPILQPTLWDALLILRRTGIRFSELVHLEAPSQPDHQGCLEQDADGIWWLRINRLGTKALREYRIPIHPERGVIEAIRRQCQRIMDMPDSSGEHILFRHCKRRLTSTDLRNALRKLAPHLLYEGQPYVITISQLRHTLLLDAFEHGTLFAMAKYLGHTDNTSPYMLEQNPHTLGQLPASDRPSQSTLHYYHHRHSEKLQDELSQWRKVHLDRKEKLLNMEQEQQDNGLQNPDQ